VLQHWLTLLRQGELFAQFAEQLQQLVAQRCCPAPQAPEIPAAGAAGWCDAGGVQQLCRQLLLQVQSLVQVEAEAVAAADVVAAAKGLLVTQPEGLLQRLVLQVRCQDRLVSPERRSDLRGHSSSLKGWFLTDTG